MALGDALYAEISGGHYTRQDDEDEGQEYTLQDALEDLGRGQSVSALARELGVARTTLRRWIAGGQPKSDVSPIIAVGQAARRAEYVADREDDLRAGMGRVTMTGWLTVSKDVSRRTINAQTLQLAPDLGDRLMDAYLNGAGPAKLRQVFISGVGEPWYRSQMRNNALNVITVDGWA